MRSSDETVARIIKCRTDSRDLGLVDIRDRANVVNRATGQPQLVFDEGHDVAAGDSAAVSLRVESNDAAMVLAVKGYDHVRFGRNGRR